MPLIDYEGTSPQFDREKCFVAPDAILIGRVRLAKAASVWFGSVLRGDNEWIDIGERSNLQEGVICHTDMGYPLVVGRDCVIGHRAVLHGCEIGDGCLVGIGAIILNGGQIGEGSIVAAGALVAPGKSFPPRSLIAGLPGRRIREVSSPEAARTIETAARYARKATAFRQMLAATSA